MATTRRGLMVEDGQSRLPVDRGWAWIIVFAYFISIFCMVGLAKSFGILLEEFVAYFDVKVAVAATIMGVAGGVYTLTAPICVAAGQHYSQRVVVMCGGLVGCIGLSLSCLLFSIEWVIIMFGVFFGFGNACVFGSGLVILGKYFRKWRGLANGLALSGASVGQFVIPPLLQLLLDLYALQGTLLIIGGIYLNVVICGALYRPMTFYMQKTPGKRSAKLIENGTSQQHKEKMVSTEKEPLRNAADENEVMCMSGEEDQAMGESVAIRYRTTSTGSVVDIDIDTKQPLQEDHHNHTQSKEVVQKSCCGNFVEFLTSLIDFSVLKSYIVALFVVSSFLLFFGHFNFILFMPATASSRGISKYDKAYLVSITGGCDLVGRIAIGILGDLKFIARYKLMALTTFICGLSIFGFAFSYQYWLMGLMAGMYGFFGGCYVSINAPTLIELVGLQSMARVLGVVLFIQGLGAAIGQPVLGAIKDEMGTYNLVLYINSISMVLGSILLSMYPLVKRFDRKYNNKTPTTEVHVGEG